MMLGTCAQPLSSGGSNNNGGGARGDLASADFINGVYSVGASVVTAADVVSDTDRISASGLSILANTAVDLLGDFRDVLFPADVTVVIEWAAAASEWAGHRVYLLSITAADESELSIYTLALSPVLYQSYQPNVAGLDRTVFFDDEATVSTNKIAVTGVESRLSGALNGGTVYTTTDSLSTAVFSGASIASHNGTTDPAGYIRKIDVYSSVPDADLPSLSA